jgi:putative peptide zinc metalloprotease protein
LAGGDRTERLALWLYAPIAWLYRVGVSVLIVTWAADQAALLGIVVALWSLWGLGVQPVSRLITNLVSSSEVMSTRGRVWLVSSVMVVSAVGLIAWVPVPASMVMEGVVWLPDEAQVRAPVDGQVDTVWVSGEQVVQKGQPLITLAAPVLQTQLKVLQSQMERSEAELNLAFGVDAMKAQNAQEALNRDRAALARLQADLDAQVLRAAKRGRVVLSRGVDLTGREVNRGDVLAFVLSSEPSVVRVVVPQADVDNVRRRLKDVSIMLDERPGHVLQGRFLREVPAPADRLPNAALSDRMGGRVMSDPQDPDGLRTLEPVYVMDVAMAESWPRAGGLAKVRLTLKPQSLMDTLVQRWRQLFLKHFSGLPG